MGPSFTPKDALTPLDTEAAAFNSGFLAGARAALEMAARAQCSWCRSPSKFWKQIPENGIHKNRQGLESEVRCKAERIRALTPESVAEGRGRIER